jgi:hypothetical protein
MQQIALEGGSLEAMRAQDGSLDWLAALPARLPDASQGSTESISTIAVAGEGGRHQAGQLAVPLYDAGFATPLQVGASLPLLHARFELDPKHGFSVDKLAGELADIKLGNAAQPEKITLAKLSAAFAHRAAGAVLEPGAWNCRACAWRWSATSRGS